MTCRVCENEQVSDIDALLAGGTSIRAASQMLTTAAPRWPAHKQHAQSSPRFGVIRSHDGSDGPLEPLAEALTLAARATTDRQKLQALEAVRAATSLAVKAMRGGKLDHEMLGRLDDNLIQAGILYRSVSGFENALRGWLAFARPMPLGPRPSLLR